MSSIEETVSVDKLFGVKSGMTRIFDEAGNALVVTVVKLIPNIITQVKTTEKDGYQSYQVGYVSKREKLLSKPTKGHLAKAGVAAESLTSFKEVQPTKFDAAHLGKVAMLAGIKNGAFVDVTGTSKGKGFQGVVKRWGFAGGPASHGSMFHRRSGSIGNRATPARVFPEKKMPGHMGVDRVTVQNLKVVEVNLELGYVLIKGSVPGSKESILEIRNSIKK